jgi:hypothetical protein
MDVAAHWVACRTTNPQAQASARFISAVLVLLLSAATPFCVTLQA